MEKVTGALIEWGVATLTLPGQSESGDRHVVLHFPRGVLVGVVDGLGHGEEAATAAKIAVETLERHAQESPISLVRRCHEKLRGTRGAVMSMASFNTSDGTMTWLGVGNVAGLLQHGNAHIVPGQEALLLRGGVVGDQLPRLHASIIQITPGDTLIFATDGIRSGYTDNLNANDAPQRIADRIMARYARRTDDALVLVARFIEGEDAPQRE